MPPLGEALGDDMAYMQVSVSSIAFNRNGALSSKGNGSRRSSSIAATKSSPTSGLARSSPPSLCTGY